MRMTSRRFNNMVKKVIERKKDKLKDYRVDDVAFYNVNIRKQYKKDEYEIIVSVDEIEVPNILIRDIVEETAEILGIKVYRILVEL